ncbi:hypothetical protein PSJE_05130 [Pseudomonas jessenii]|nr:hypothetical protein PSJE_05130 [Pseudomonas jessenii]
MGASLLAIAVYQSTSSLNDTPQSRASSLPHLLLRNCYLSVYTTPSVETNGYKSPFVIFSAVSCPGFFKARIYQIYQQT